MSTLYDRSFFDAQSFKSLQSARLVLPELFRHVQVGRVVDVGCGVGTWLRAAGDLGVADRLGVDGDYVDRDALLVPQEQFLAVDLALPGLAEAVATNHSGLFDLVMCLEVAEHLPFERSAGLVDDLCRLGDVVLFSAAIPFQHGTGHINEQWPEFWATHFRARGFACFDLIRPLIWGRQDVNWWYAQNLLIFAKEGSEAYARLPADAAVGTRPLSKVHPEAWLSTLLNTWHPHRAVARTEEPEDFRALLRAWTSGAELTPPLRAIERARAAPPGARNVFPFTRTEVDDPDRLLTEAEARTVEAQVGAVAAEREGDRLRADVADLRAQAEALLVERENDRLACEKAQADATFAEREGDRLRADVADLRAQAEALLVERENDRLACEKAQADATFAERECDRLREELAALQVQTEALLVGRGNDRLECESLRMGLDEARAGQSSAQAKLNALQLHASTLKAANATLRGQITRHETLLSEAARRGEDAARLQLALDGASEEVATLRVETAAMHTHAAALLASTSWRVTGPLRALRRLFG